MSKNFKAATEDQTFELDLSDHATTVQVLFRYERTDGQPLGPKDGGSIGAFGALLQTVGACLQQGKSANEILLVCKEAGSAFQAVISAAKQGETN